VIDFDDWLQYGYQQGWCGPAVCSTHDGTPMSDSEANEFDEGDEPCIHVLRLYADPEEKAAVEADHSPSQWRASNRGLSA
jgi:hypothetical protein